jgi:L-threonylcarbamoyladenylate synthase
MKHLIHFAAQKITSGNLVAFPTETVYGLGANALSGDACLKIYELKSRPSYNPLIVHVATLEQAFEIGDFSNNAKRVANAFWPGPLSIVVKLKDIGISKIVTAGLDSIAIRIPNHEIALDLINRAGVPIAAPSANPSNYISPTLACHVKKHFESSGIMILDGGRSSIGLESTIIDARSDKIKILRHGYIGKAELEEIGVNIDSDMQHTEIIAPGMMLKHYSPKTPIILNFTNQQQEFVEKRIALNFGQMVIPQALYSLNLSIAGNLAEAASNLYVMLRELDEYAQNNNISFIEIAPIPYYGLGIAINDKLKRAAVNE